MPPSPSPRGSLIIAKNSSWLPLMASSMAGLVLPSSCVCGGQGRGKVRRGRAGAGQGRVYEWGEGELVGEQHASAAQSAIYLSSQQASSGSQGAMSSQGISQPSCQF